MEKEKKVAALLKVAEEKKEITKEKISKYLDKYSLINNILLDYQAKQEYQDVKGYKAWIDDGKQVKKR